jgi:hypothetical protein
VYVGTQVLSVGEAPVTIAGQRMALSSNGLVIGSNVTLPLPPPSKLANAQAAFNTTYSAGYTASGTTRRPGAPTKTTKPSGAALAQKPADILKLLPVALGAQFLGFVL